MSSQHWAQCRNPKEKRYHLAYIAGSGFGIGRVLPPYAAIIFCFFSWGSVFITTQAFQTPMGREIFTISVPIGSQVWERLVSWREDKQVNVSANVCAAIQSDMDKVDRVLARDKRHEWLGQQMKELNPECGCRGLTLEQWNDFFHLEE